MDRTPTGEGFLRLFVLCPEEGLRLLLMRQSGAKSAPRPPDLFDLADFEVRQRDEGAAFVSDCRILSGFPHLAHNLTALTAACRFARVLLLNGVPPENASSTARLLDRALAAFASGTRPDVTYLKALFVHLRSEGYPAREDWLASLGEDTRGWVEDLLARPVAGQLLPEDVVRTLARRLETWAKDGPDFRFPEN